MPPPLIHSPILLMMIKVPLWILLLCAPVGFGVKIRNQCSYSPVDWHQSVRASESPPLDLVFDKPRNMQVGGSCNLNQDHQIQGVILLDLYGEPHLLTVKETNALASLILETLNEISSCDSGQFRTMKGSQLVPATFENLGTRPFTLEFNVVGTCRGCSTQTTLLEHLDSSGQPTDTCPCGGPSLLNFQILLKEKFDDLLANRKISNIESLKVATEIDEAPSCPEFKTFTTSDVIVEFYGCPLDLQQDDVDLLASRIKDTYNYINGLNSRLCDRFFREIVSVTGSLSSDYIVSNYNESESSQGNFECPDYFEILFQVTARCRGCDVTTITLFDEEEDVNFFNGYRDRSRILGKTTLSPIFGDAILDEGTAIGKQVPNDGAQQSFDLNAKASIASSELEQVDSHRRLAVQSNCQCPLDPEFRAVTEDEMIAALNATLLAYNDNLSDLSVEDVIEIEDVACNPDANSFQTVIDVEFLTDSEDGVITDQIATTLKEGFLQSYNSLSERFCDPYFRYLETADIVSQSTTRVNRDRELLSKPLAKFTFIYKAQFSTTGRCKGCPSSITALHKVSLYAFAYDWRNLARPNSSSVFPQERRRQQKTHSSGIRNRRKAQQKVSKTAKWRQLLLWGR
jgi:hypothetical protein